MYFRNSVVCKGYGISRIYPDGIVKTTGGHLRARFMSPICVESYRLEDALLKLAVLLDSASCANGLILHELYKPHSNFETDDELVYMLSRREISATPKKHRILPLRGEILGGNTYARGDVWRYEDSLAAGYNSDTGNHIRYTHERYVLPDEVPGISTNTENSIKYTLKLLTEGYWHNAVLVTI